MTEQNDKRRVGWARQRQMPMLCDDFANIQYTDIFVEISYKLIKINR